MKYKGWRIPLRELRELVRIPENRRKIALIFLFSAAVSGLLWIRGTGGGNRFIVNERGRLVGILREDDGRESTFPLTVEIRSGETSLRKELLVTLRGEKAERTHGRSKKEKDSVAELERSVSEVQAKLQERRGRKIMLPTKTEEGAVLRWERVPNRSPLKVMVLPFFYLLFLYAGRNEKERKAAEKRRHSILQSLPSFCDQLLLMMNCGLIFRDAFARIAEGYQKHGVKDDYFRGMIVEMEHSARSGKRNLVPLLEEQARAIGNRSFSRLVNLISDNQRKGTDMTGKLREDAATLWEERKQAAAERGKLAETKLSLPLAMLLMVLIVITAAPAMLQVKGV